VADGDGLENHCGGNVTVGSNPTPSAPTSARRAARAAMARAQVGWPEKHKSQVANIEKSPGYSRGAMSMLPRPCPGRRNSA
jgi:hypothetical protein